MSDLIFIVGMPGSGKSTALIKLHDLTRSSIIKIETTNREKANIKPHIYSYVDKWDSVDYDLEISDDFFKYGIPKESHNKDYSIIGLEACFIDSITNFRKTFSGNILTIGLDTIDSIETQKQRTKLHVTETLNESEFSNQHNIVKNCDVLLRGEPHNIQNAISATIECLSSRGGIIQKSLIEKFLNAGILLDNSSNKISPASYDLRLGDDVWCQGKFLKLNENNPVLKIPAYSYVIVTSIELANLPSFISGRFDLKNSLFFRGVILSNGPQIDPGYRGALFCMLYNGSDQPIGISRGDHFATMEFVTTTGLDLGYRDEYQNKTRLIDFMPASAAVSEGGKIIENTENKINKLTSDWNLFRTLLLGLFALIVAPSFIILFNVISTWSDIKTEVETKLNEIKILELKLQEHALVYPDCIIKNTQASDNKDSLKVKID